MISTNPTISFIPDINADLSTPFPSGQSSLVGKEQIDISVVLPVYKSAQSLKELHQRLSTVVASLTNQYELIFVEDGSPDSSWEDISELSARDFHVRGVKLSRNFGQHAAISAGLASSRGQSVIVMDADLQDPPECIPRLINLAKEGKDIVTARRIGRKYPFWRNVCAYLYFKTLNTLAQSNIDGSCATFSLLSRKVVDAYLKLNDSSRHYLFILFWLGFERTSIEYEHQSRSHGKSSYSFTKLVQHALQGIYFQSNKLLELIILVGVLTTLLGLFSGAAVVISCFCSTPLASWAIIASIILLTSGFNLMALGLVGLYVGQTFEQVKHRPLYVIDEETNPPTKKESLKQKSENTESC